MNRKFCKNIVVNGAIASLFLLPGCGVLDKFKTGEDRMISSSENRSATNRAADGMTGEVVATMNGKTIISSDSLEQEKNNVLKSKPEFAAALSFMDPNVLNRNLTEGLVSSAVVDEWVVDQGIDKSAEYMNELADIEKNMKRILNAKFFSQKFTISVSDSEVSAFYETNKKAIPELMISQGGVAASGIKFDTEVTAKEFLAQVRAANNNFMQAAQQAGNASSIKDFKMVNAQSIGIDSQLRDKILAIKSVPSIELIVANGAIWVVNATSKENPKYVPFEQVKANIKQLLENNKRGEIYEVEINKLKDTYNVKINEDYFKGAKNESDMDSEDVADLGAKREDKKDVAPKRVA